MAFGIGTSASISQWFDYKDGIRLKIRSANNELYLAKNEDAGIQYRAQKDDNNKKPFHHFQYKAEAYLIEDWQGVEVMELTDEGGTEPKEVPYSADVAYKIFLHGGINGAEMMAFVSSKALKIAQDYELNRQVILGKSKNSTSGKRAKQVKQNTNENS